MYPQESSIDELITRYYGIEPSHLTLLGDFWNTTYRVDSVAGESFVLRIATPSVKNAASIENETYWLNYVSANSDLFVPEAVATIEGNWVTQLEIGSQVRFCCLFRWIEGEHAAIRYDENTLQHIGGIVGTLHHLARGSSPPKSMNRPVEIRHSDQAEIQRVRDTGWLDWMKEHMAMSQDDIRILSSAREIVLAELKLPEGGKENTGLVHGDLHLGNFIVTSNQVAIIDFDQLSWGHFSVELAWLMASTVDIFPLPEFGRREVCLTSYQEVSALPFSSEKDWRGFEVRVAFFHLLSLEWLHGLSDREMRRKGSKTIQTRIRALHDFIAR